jgi:hypothetical protein
MDVECFIDGPDGSPRDSVHLLFAEEKVRPTYPAPSEVVKESRGWGFQPQQINLLRLEAPATFRSAEVTESVRAEDYQILSLEALVRMKLNSFRRKDQVHLLDLLEIGLIDASWLPRLLPEHAARLQQLIDDPDG